MISRQIHDNGNLRAEFVYVKQLKIRYFKDNVMSLIVQQVVFKRSVTKRNADISRKMRLTRMHP